MTLKSDLSVQIVFIATSYLYLHLTLIIYQMLLSKVTYKWGQWKQSKSSLFFIII